MDQKGQIWITKSLSEQQKACAQNSGFEVKEIIAHATSREDNFGGSARLKIMKFHDFKNTYNSYRF